MSTTLTSSTLDKDEKQSLLSKLGELKKESIRQSGNRLATERLTGRTYNGMTPEKFFDHFYDLRSRLVHGDSPYPTQIEVQSCASALEVFVSNLLAGPFLDNTKHPKVQVNISVHKSLE